VLVHRQVGRFGAHSVVLDRGGGGAGVRFSGAQLCLLRGDLVENLLLVELRQHLALVDLRIDVGIELCNDARGLRLNLNLSNRLDFTRGDDRLSDVPAFDLAQLRRIDLAVVASRHNGNAECQDDDDGDATDPENAL